MSYKYKSSTHSKEYHHINTLKWTQICKHLIVNISGNLTCDVIFSSDTSWIISFDDFSPNGRSNRVSTNIQTCSFLGKIKVFVSLVIHWSNYTTEMIKWNNKEKDCCKQVILSCNYICMNEFFWKLDGCKKAFSKCILVVKCHTSKLLSIWIEQLTFNSLLEQCSNDILTLKSTHNIAS